jgi:hypothetical protein
MQAQKSIEERSNINQNQNQTNPNQITPILDRQIDEITADLPKSYGKTSTARIYWTILSHMLRQTMGTDNGKVASVISNSY